MILSLHWKLKLQNPKNKQQELESKASAYLFDSEYRICFSNHKQKYYFAIPFKEYSENALKSEAEAYFILNRNELSVAKCIRCSKWHVIEGQFCERCLSVINNPSNTTKSSIELDIEL